METGSCRGGDGSGGDSKMVVGAVEEEVVVGK